jgi:cytidine deaminase
MSGSSDGAALSAEDLKLVTLARATRARVGAEEGAAVRDSDGRTYAAASVELPSLRLTALQVCVAMAHSSGSRGLEAAVRLAAGGPSDLDRRALLEFAGDEVVVHLGDPRGTVGTTTSAAGLAV